MAALFSFLALWKTEQNGTEPDLRVKKRGKVGMFRWRGKDRPCSTNCSLIGRFSPRLNKGGQARRRNIVVKFPSRYSIPVKRCDKLSPSIFPLLFVLLPPLFWKSWNAWKRNDSIVLLLFVKLLENSRKNSFLLILIQISLSTILVARENEKYMYLYLYFFFFENFCPLPN